MNVRKFRKGFLIFILSFGLSCVFYLCVSWQEQELFDTKQLNNSHALAVHYMLPANFKGKKLPFHRVYESRQVGFPEDLKKNQNFNETKTILLWTPWNGVKQTINFYSLQPGNASFVNFNCPNKKCITTYDRSKLETADAVLFHLLDTKSSDLPQYRTSKQIWILYNLEPPWLIKRDILPELLRFRNLFNWTMSYRYDSDVTARYGFIKPIINNVMLVPFWKKTKNIVWFVSDCTTGSKREDYVKELQKYIDVDIYGLCGTYRCYPSQSSVCYDEILEKYKFYLSFENAICKDYVTEKFFNAFNYDIIPVFFGATNYTSIAPEGTFIDATEYPQPEKLAKLLRGIGNNEELYRNMLLKKKSFTAYLDPWMCRLCDKLHTNNKSATVYDVEKWWLDDAKCVTWNKRTNNFEGVR